MNVSAWSRARGPPLGEETAHGANSLLSLCLKIKIYKTTSVCLFVRYDTRICAIIHNVTVTLAQQPQNSHMANPGLRPWVRLVPVAPLAGASAMNDPQPGRFAFPPQCIHVAFISNSDRSGKSGVRFSMPVAMLYYTWHLSIKEETLLKQTGVKLGLSSTSDLPLLLSTKRKFVLEQW